MSLDSATPVGHVNRQLATGWQAGRALLAEIHTTERARAQLWLALGAVAVSAYLGWTQTDEFPVAGWQLWFWLGTIAFVLYILWPLTPPPGVRWSRRVGWGLAGLGLLALGLRGVLLEQFGLHVDESGVADFVLRHVLARLGETANPFLTGSSSQPILHYYLVRLSLDFVGQTITGLRLPSVVAGSLGVMLTWALVAEVSGRRTATLTALVMATYHFHIHWSRIALNNIWDTVWVPLMLLGCVWGWKHRWSGGALIAGVAVGFSQYFYAGSKVGVLLIGLWLIGVWRTDPAWDWRWACIFIGKLALTALVIGLPITLFAGRHPDIYFIRTREVYGWSEAAMRAAQGSSDPWAYLGFQIRHAIGGFVDLPDITGFYGPGVPLTLELATPLWMVGVVWAMRQKLYLPVAWFGLTLLFGSVMLGGNPSSSHVVVAIPAVCWLIVLVPEALWQAGYGWLAVALVAVVMGTDVYFYFGHYLWHPHPDLRLPFPIIQ